MFKEVESEEEFDAIVSTYPLCIAGFYSPRCRKCKEIAPFFMELASKYKALQVLRVNILKDENIALLQSFSVTSPTLFIFKKGEPILRMEVERYSLEEIKERVSEILKRFFGE